MVSAFIFGFFILFVLLSVPLAVGLGLSTVLTIFFTDIVKLQVVAQKMFTAVDSFPLMAIPFFMIAGSIMEKGGISRRLIRLANALIGFLPGGLALVAILASMFFAAISGSAPATVAAIGAIMIPAMVNNGYREDFAAATQASAGYIGVIIPPSIPMITFGVATGASIGGLFMGGFIPGILIGVALGIVAFITSKKHNYRGVDQRPSLREVWESFVDAIWGILMPVIILGGIYGGIFTPTEAGNVAVVYGLLIGFFVYKELALKNLPSIIRSAAVSTAMVMLIIGAASAFGLILTRELVPVKVANFLISVTDSPYVLLLLINIMLLIVGMFMETNAAIIILAPILYPAVVNMGIDPIHFGIIMVVNLAIGIITPPLGMNLFVASGMRKIPVDSVVRANWGYLAISIAVLMLITYVPQLTLWLPNLLTK